MKFKIIILSLGLLLTARGACAQWVVSDPTNLAQGIVNSTKQSSKPPRTAKPCCRAFRKP